MNEEGRVTIRQRGKLREGAVCVLTSGGLDSGVLLSELVRVYPRVFPVYVKGGLVWEEAELHWLKRFLQEINSISLRELHTLSFPIQDVYSSHWSVTNHNVPDYSSQDEAVYLPGRNLILLSKAAVFCALHRIGAIALGILKGNPFPDGSPSFFRAFERVVTQGLSVDLKLLTPFSHASKSEVIRGGKGLPLEMTFSCISPIELYHCGLCNKCAERQRAFLEAGVEDRTVYRQRVERRGIGEGEQGDGVFAQGTGDTSC